jgi:tetrahydromethanopterin S-methyltransferase subunit H
VSEYQPLFGLLVNTLELEDAGLDDYLDYLEHIKDTEIYISSKEEESKISSIYKALNELAIQDRTKAVKAKIGYVSSDVFYVLFSQ